MFTKLVESVILVLAVAVVARVVWELLGPLVPGLIVFFVVGAILISILRGPRSGGFFRK